MAKTPQGAGAGAAGVPRPAGDLPAVLVTRPAREAAQWTLELRRLGFHAEALPLIAISPVTAPEHQRALEAAWHDLGSFAAVMFVSSNAVEHFFKQKRTPSQAIRAQIAIKSIANDESIIRLPKSLRFLAPGPGTAACLLAAGVPAAQIDSPPVDAAQFDSPSLWQVVRHRDWRQRRVLIVRGQGASGELALSEAPGRDWITRQWQQAGAAVETVSVYQRSAPVLAPGELQRAREASGDGSVWLFSSSEAVLNLAGLLPQGLVDWRGAVAVATHPRIAATAEALGWGRVAPARPALMDVAAALHSLGVGPSR